MISSKQYEAYHVMLWTMRNIKVTNVKDSDKKLFHVQCNTQTYQHGNAGLRKRHPTMFKEDTFSCTPIDELVLAMPFEFINWSTTECVLLKHCWIARYMTSLEMRYGSMEKQMPV